MAVLTAERKRGRLILFLPTPLMMWGRNTFDGMGSMGVIRRRDAAVRYKMTRGGVKRWPWTPWLLFVMWYGGRSGAEWGGVGCLP